MAVTCWVISADCGDLDGSLLAVRLGATTLTSMGWAMKSDESRPILMVTDTSSS